MTIERSDDADALFPREMPTEERAKQLREALLLYDWITYHSQNWRMRPQAERDAICNAKR